LSNVELGGVNGVKRGKSHHNLTAAQAAISKWCHRNLGTRRQKYWRMA